MRQLMHQIVTLIPNQRIRLAQKHILPYNGTIHILRPAGVENGLGSQGRETRTEENDNCILAGPETTDAGIDAANPRVESDIVGLLHVRRRADEGGGEVAAAGGGGGDVEDVGHEALDVGFEDGGFVHGGVAVEAEDAALDVEEGEDHGRLGEGDGVFDGGLCGGAVVDGVGGGEGEEEVVEELEGFHRSEAIGSRSLIQKIFESEEKRESQRL